MNRILIRAPNWIGDQVLAYPFFYLLRLHYPKAWIAVVSTEWVSDIQFHGLVDEIFIIPRKKGDSIFRSFFNIWKFSKMLKSKGPWDLGITLPNSFGTALLLYLSGAKNRRGYQTDARGILLTQKVKWDPHPNTHRSQAYANLLQFEGLPSYDMRDFWKLSTEESFDAFRCWPDSVPLQPPLDPYFIVAPGATADSRRWSEAQFAEFIRMACDKWKLKAVIVGGNAEKHIALEFLRLGLAVEDYTAKGWVSAHSKLFAGAKFTLCNESGLAHVAALCGSPVQIVCGAADPRRTQPIGPAQVQVKYNEVNCWPCEKNVCQFQDERQNQCLKGIHPSQVIREIELGLL